MNAQQFSQYLQTMYERAGRLYERTSVPTQDEPELAADSLEELRISLEELHVAEEELLQQNEELMTARAQVEAERKRYYELFEFAPDGYLVTDTFGIISEINCTAAVMLNVSQRFLIGKPLINYISYNQRKLFRTQLQQLHQKERLQEWEVHISPRHTDEYEAALTVATIRDDKGQLLGWRWLMREISTRKKTEAQLREIQLQNLQLQEAARLKSHFLAIMSHELRTPMNAIIGFTQLLLRLPQASLSSQQENMVQRILNNAKHLLKLIDDVLDFSKLDASSLELKPQEFNIVDVVNFTVDEIRSLVEQKNLNLDVLINLQNPIVFNDQMRLRQICINLIANAIKFTDSGSICIEISELPSDRIAIAVQDTGIGIAPNDLEQIFIEFRQVNQTLTRTQGGTGLGLSIGKRLVEKMQGQITVESQLGQGSTFKIEIPRNVKLAKFDDPQSDTWQLN